MKTSFNTFTTESFEKQGGGEELTHGRDRKDTENNSPDSGDHP
jgi:hypothetical protein